MQIQNEIIDLAKVLVDNFGSHAEREANKLADMLRPKDPERAFRYEIAGALAGKLNARWPDLRPITTRAVTPGVRRRRPKP